MTNKEQLNTLFELYNEGLISKYDLASGIKNINGPEQKDNLVIDEDILSNDLYKTDEARRLAQESRNESKTLRERIAQRDADRLEREAKEKREEELKAIHEELSDDRKIMMDILSSFKNRVTGDSIYSARSLQHMSTKDLLKLYNDMEINAPIALKQIIDSKGYTEWAERRAAKEVNDEVENTKVNSEPEVKVDDKSDKLVVDENQSKHEKSMNELDNMGLSQDNESIVDYEYFGDDPKEQKAVGYDIDVNSKDNASVDDAEKKNDIKYTDVLDPGYLDNTEKAGDLLPDKDNNVQNDNDSEEKAEDLLPNNNADLTPERHRLVSMIAGAKSRLQGIVNNKAAVALSAAIAIGGAVAVIATGPVGFTALGALAQATGSAALIGGGGVVSATAANEFNKGRKL